MHLFSLFPTPTPLGFSAMVFISIQAIDNLKRENRRSVNRPRKHVPTTASNQLFCRDYLLRSCRSTCSQEPMGHRLTWKWDMPKLQSNFPVKKKLLNYLYMCDI